MSKILDHDAYIAAAPEALRSQLAHVREQLKNVLPDADEVIQYGMPGFSAGNKIIAGYGAFSKQCGLYVAKGAIADCFDDITAAGLKASKTGVTFSPSKPIPAKLISALALASRRELAK
jgi:uncharacterized protein YdhG (YjbR/CyaY superfamily)